MDRSILFCKKVQDKKTKHTLFLFCFLFFENNIQYITKHHETLHAN